MMEGSVLPESRHRPPGEALPGRIAVSPQAVQAALIVLGVALLTFILYLYVLPNSQIDAAELRIVELKQQKAALERQNATLLQEITRNGDIKTLEQRAKQLGMGPAPNAIYLRLPSTGPTPAAQPPDKLAASAAQPVQETLRERLREENLQDQLRTVRLSVSKAVDTIFQRLRRQ